MLTKIERETIFNFNEEEEMATIYTASDTVYRRLIKRGYKVTEKVTLGGKECGWTFEIPKKHVVLPRQPRVLSKENKLKLAERAKALFGRKK